MRRTPPAALALCLTTLAAPALADGYALELIEIGQRDYYCTATLALTNLSDTPLTEVNLHILLFVGEEQVGRSKGSSFLSVDAGGQVEAVFETPNAPCEEVDRYVPVVGACRIGAEFEDRATCAAALRPVAPVVAAVEMGG